MSRNDALRNLARALSDPCLKSSARLMILISLSINERLSFSDLLELTGLGKGSLSNHIEKLSESGYVRTKRVTVFGGHRVMVQITEKGLSAYKDYLEILSSLSKEITGVEDEAKEEIGKNLKTKPWHNNG